MPSVNWSHEHTAADLNRAFTELAIRSNIAAIDDGVQIPREDARQLLAALSFQEGGNRLPFVNSLLQRPPTDGIILRGDEGRHLWRALEDISRSRRRAAQIDRGHIPGALSSSEAVRVARTHPGLFRGGR